MDYKTAYNQARAKATEFNIDMGIEKTVEFGKIGFRTFMLPKPENRQGHELRCEVVQPNSPEI